LIHDEINQPSESINAGFCKTPFSQNQDHVEISSKEPFSPFADNLPRQIETFANLDSGTWTITVTAPSGVTCLVASGQGFERLYETTLEGDPA
jgi:hypothetical protein